MADAPYDVPAPGRVMHMSGFFKTSRPKGIVIAFSNGLFSDCTLHRSTIVGVWLGVSKGVEDGRKTAARRLPCSRATPETTARPFQGWPACGA
jgi:hypothetical protein